MQYVFLTDGDNGTALVACPDAATAEKVAASGVFSFGDVSAWMMLDAALTEPEKVIEILRGDGDVSALVAAELESEPILIAQLPKGHLNVVATCVHEAEANLDQNDATTEADVAADIVRKLQRDYLGGE